MSTTLARLAAAVLSTGKDRKTVGWVIAPEHKAKLFGTKGGK